MQTSKPALTTKAKILANEDRVRLYGSFDFIASPTRDNPERIEVKSPDWKKNLVTVRALASIGKPFREPIVHKLVAPHIEALFKAWEAEGLADYVLSWNGSYVARFKRGRAPLTPPILSSELAPEARADLVSRLSAHSWGSAFDINARWNPLGKPPTASIGSVRPLVSIAEDLGWIWGGRWGTPDPMHFELGDVSCTSM